VEHPPGFERLVATHDQLHQVDGSIPNMDDGSERDR
jgi:hypothetical protein